MGLVPVRVAVWGPFILLNFENGVLPENEADFDLVGNEWLGNSSQILIDGGVDSSLSFLCRREYTVECNWKVSSFLIFGLVKKHFTISSITDNDDTLS